MQPVHCACARMPRPTSCSCSSLFSSSDYPLFHTPLDCVHVWWERDTKTSGMLRFQLHFTCSASLFFRSRYVRAATLLSTSLARKLFPSLWSLNRTRPWFLCDSAEKQRFLGCLVDFSGAGGNAPSDALRLTTATCIAVRNQTFASEPRYRCRSNSSVLPLHADLPEKILVVSNHALLKSFVQRKSLPDVRLHVGSSIDQCIRKC